MEKTRKFKRILSCILCTGLIAAMTTVTTGCGDDNSSSKAETSVSEAADGAKSIGEGKTRFDLIVTDKDGNDTAFDVHTDKKTVGEALTELDIVQGEQSDYGLYVKTVNGLTLDYDTDGYYWAFYIDGEYAQTGVDSTDIKEGSEYQLKAEKG